MEKLREYRFNFIHEFYLPKSFFVWLVKNLTTMFLMIYFNSDLLSKTSDLTELRQVGSRRFSNIIVAISLNLGGLGCLISGLSSFLRVDLFTSSEFQDNTVFLQDIVRVYYGVVGLTIGLFLSLSIYWSLGQSKVYLDSRFTSHGLSGCQFIRVERQGFPGKNRLIRLKVRLDDVRYLVVRVISGLYPSRQLLILLKDKREILLTDCEKLSSLASLEGKATTIAKTLKLNVKFK